MDRLECREIEEVIYVADDEKFCVRYGKEIFFDERST